MRTHIPGNLRRYVRALHVKIQLKCPAAGCNYSTTSPGSMQNHFRTRHHSDPAVSHPFACSFPGCTHRSLSTRDVRRHFESRHNPHRTKDIHCPSCTKKFYNDRSVQKHVKRLHRNEKQNFFFEITRFSVLLETRDVKISLLKA